MSLVVHLALPMRRRRGTCFGSSWDSISKLSLSFGASGRLRKRCQMRLQKRCRKRQSGRRLRRRHRDIAPHWISSLWCVLGYICEPHPGNIICTILAFLLHPCTYRTFLAHSFQIPCTFHSLAYLLQILKNQYVIHNFLWIFFSRSLLIPCTSLHFFLHCYVCYFIQFPCTLLPYLFHIYCIFLANSLRISFLPLAKSLHTFFTTTVLSLLRNLCIFLLLKIVLFTFSDQLRTWNNI